ncbi:MAG: hypothetical protein NTX84_01100 [Nitrospirae bacterium]|nr:hypothetical protein [Nitrospirota bacterium]
MKRGLEASNGGQQQNNQAPSLKPSAPRLVLGQAHRLRQEPQQDAGEVSQVCLVSLVYPVSLVYRVNGTD